jgi:hypothetical protein
MLYVGGLVLRMLAIFPALASHHPYSLPSDPARVARGEAR